MNTQLLYDNCKKAISFIRNDLRRQTVAVTVPSVMASVVYASLNIIAAIWSRSLWLGTMAFFYVVTVSLKIYVLVKAGQTVFSWKKNSKNTPAASYKSFSKILIACDLILGIALMNFSFKGLHREYPGYTLYLSALYVFFRLTMSAYNVFKATRSRSFIVLSIRKIDVTKSLVSLLILQSALISRFGDPLSGFSRGMHFYCSLGAFIIIMFMGIEGLWASTGKRGCELSV